MESARCECALLNAVGRVPFEQLKFRYFEPVIFVEWKAPGTRVIGGHQ